MKNKTILYIGMSLDGYIAGPNDDLSWLDEYNEIDYGYNDFFKTIGSLIEGRRTYDIEVQKGWVGVHPVPVFVLSNEKPKEPPKDYHFVNGELKDVLDQARKAAGEKHVWIGGGANVAQQFINEGLVDEIELTIIPKMIGSGVRLLDNIENVHTYSLINVKQFEKGLVQMTYVPV
jgi:dihydrofolate reductase